MGSSLREDTIRALDFLKKEFNTPVRLHCNHGQNKENLHWGIERYNSLFVRKAFDLLTRFTDYPTFEGNKPDSPYYWSDIADTRIEYIRAFTFRRLNGATMVPGRPFHDSRKQSGPIYFHTTDASDVSVFNKFVTPASVDKLRKEKGWAIISTHLGKGYYRDNQLDPAFRETIEYLASQPGWYVPVSELLDHLVEQLGAREISAMERQRVEFGHILDRIKGRFIDPSLY